MMERYQKSKDFREYVDRFCTTYKRTAEDSLQLALVREVAAYYGMWNPAGYQLRNPHMCRWGECK